MAMLPFSLVFTKHPDGSLEPIRKIKIGTLTTGPGARFSQRVFLGEIDISSLIGCDIEAVEEGQTLVIKEFHW